MKKLMLSVEALSVDSFQTVAPAKPRPGTVIAAEATQGGPNTCNIQCCQTCATCPVTPTYAATCYC